MMPLAEPESDPVTTSSVNLASTRTTQAPSPTPARSSARSTKRKAGPVSSRKPLELAKEDDSADEREGDLTPLRKKEKARTGLEIVEVPVEAEVVEAGKNGERGGLDMKRQKAATARTLFDNSPQQPFDLQKHQSMPPLQPFRPPIPRLAPLRMLSTHSSVSDADERPHRRPIRDEQSSSIATSHPRQPPAVHPNLSRSTAAVRQRPPSPIPISSSPARADSFPLPLEPISTTLIASPPLPPPILRPFHPPPSPTRPQPRPEPQMPRASAVPPASQQFAVPPPNIVIDHSDPHTVSKSDRPISFSPKRSHPSTQVPSPIKLSPPTVAARPTKRSFAIEPVAKAPVIADPFINPGQYDPAGVAQEERLAGQPTPTQTGDEWLDEDIEMALLAEHEALAEGRYAFEEEEGVEVPPGSLHVAALERRPEVDEEIGRVEVDSDEDEFAQFMSTYLPNLSAAPTVTGPASSSPPTNSAFASPMASPLHSSPLSRNFEPGLSSFSGLIQASPEPEPVAPLSSARPSTLVSHPDPNVGSSPARRFLTTPRRSSFAAANGSSSTRSLRSSLKAKGGGGNTSSSSLRRRKTVAFSEDDRSEGGQDGMKRRYSLSTLPAFQLQPSTPSTRLARCVSQSSLPKRQAFPHHQPIRPNTSPAAPLPVLGPVPPPPPFPIQSQPPLTRRLSQLPMPSFVGPTPSGQTSALSSSQHQQRSRSTSHHQRQRSPQTMPSSDGAIPANTWNSHPNRRRHKSNPAITNNDTPSQNPPAARPLLRSVQPLNQHLHLQHQPQLQPRLPPRSPPPTRPKQPLLSPPQNSKTVSDERPRTPLPAVYHPVSFFDDAVEPREPSKKGKKRAASSTPGGGGDAVGSSAKKRRVKGPTTKA